MKSRLADLTTRMGPDVRDALEAMPGLAGVALWVKFADTEDAALTACTDGVTVWAGARYSRLEAAERRFVLLHELLHVALAHRRGVAHWPHARRILTKGFINSPQMRSSTPRSKLCAGFAGRHQA